MRIKSTYRIVTFPAGRAVGRHGKDQNRAAGRVPVRRARRHKETFCKGKNFPQGGKTAARQNLEKSKEISGFSDV